MLCQMSTPFWSRQLKDARPLNVIRLLNIETAWNRLHYATSGYTARTPKWRQFVHLSTGMLVANYVDSSYKWSKCVFSEVFLAGPLTRVALFLSAEYAVSREFH